MIIRALLLMLSLAQGAWAIDSACTQTPNLSIYRCPEDSTDWYDSYTQIVDRLDALARTAQSSFTVTTALGVGAQGLATGQAVIQSTSTTAAHSVFRVQSNNGTSAFAVLEDGYPIAGQTHGGSIVSGTDMLIRAPEGGIAQLEWQADEGDNSSDNVFCRKADGGPFTCANSNTNSTVHLQISTAGLVGIGVNGPSYQLDVASIVRVGGGQTAGSTGDLIVFNVSGSGDFSLRETSQDVLGFIGNMALNSPVLAINFSADTVAIGKGGTPLVQISTGTFTPTATVGTNMATCTTSLARYTRLGNIVTVYGTVQMDPTAGGDADTHCELSLPIPSNFTTATDANGLFQTGTTVRGGLIQGDTSDDRVDFAYAAGSDEARTHFYTYQYVVQ